MLVKYMDKSSKYENNQESVDQLFSELENIVNTNNLIIDHMVIDGYVIYESYYDYFVHNLKNIEQVDIRILTAVEVLNETLTSTIQYLERALPEIDPLADQFYKGPTTETWMKFEQLVEGLEWLLQVMGHLTTQRKTLTNTIEMEKFELFVYNLQNKIEVMGESLEGKDMVLIGDYLLYEIHPELKNMSALLKETITKVGMHNEHN